ncbi:MAG: hypothetical protein HC930_16335 [Hydrococcus sp. SU_1_0]|nr:hypothetical protein [Hydrococcus sp. SU_1_0]
MANITDAVLHAVAKVRKKLSLSKPKLARGRPNKATRKLSQKDPNKSYKTDITSTA